MSRVPTRVLKAREVEVSYVIDERDEDDIQNLARLRKEGSHDFGGLLRDVKLTDYLTIHNVIAIDSITFEGAKQKQQNYLDGSSNPRKATVTVKLIIDNARTMRLHEEKLIGSDDVIDIPQSSVKAIT